MIADNDIAYIAGVYLIGLTLNLTPCVYPMLSVTTSIFSKNKDLAFLQSFLRAAVYVLGIMFTYTTLGVAAAMTGSVFGSWLQHRWVLFSIAILITFIALSMFGLYKIQVPSFVLNRLGGANRTGILGLFLSGLLVGVFAAPCVGPPVVALLTVASQKQDPIFAFWMFAVMSLGLSTPYLLLGTFSSALKILPKSGIWMVWVERLLGVVLLGFAAYYFILALNSEWLKWLFPGLFVFSGVYLGFFEQSGNHNPFFRLFKQLIGLAFIVLALFLLFMRPTGSIEWEMYSKDAFDQATGSKKPIVIDFYADWCLPCQEMDATTFASPKVSKAMEGFAKFKVDLTYTNDEKVMDIVDEFEIVGVPTYVFYHAGDINPTRKIVGYVGEKEFISYLKEVS